MAWAALRQTITVALNPMTIGETHAHTVGSEEVWIQIKGKSLAFMGTQLRWQTPPRRLPRSPFVEMTQANTSVGAAARGRRAIAHHDRTVFRIRTPTSTPEPSK